MLPTSIRSLPLVASLAFAQAVSAHMAHQDANQRLGRRQDSPIQFQGGADEGCYSSPGGNMVKQPADIWQSSLACGGVCQGLNKPVMALQNSYCYCGSMLPATSDKLSSSECSTTCPGYDQENCGGVGSFTIWLTGTTDEQVPRVGDDTQSKSSKSEQTSSTPSSSSTTTTTSSRSKSTSQPTHHSHPHGHLHQHKPKPKPTPTPHQTKISQTTHTSVVSSTVTTTSSSSATSSPDSGDSTDTGQTIAIAVGVIAGVVAFGAFVAAILYFIRRRRRLKNAENGHRRADSLNAFVVASSASAPDTLAGRVAIPSMVANDSRLDPRIMKETRRDSGASYLADNQDYSRRILKIANPE